MLFIRRCDVGTCSQCRSVNQVCTLSIYLDKAILFMGDMKGLDECSLDWLCCLMPGVPWNMCWKRSHPDAGVHTCSKKLAYGKLQQAHCIKEQSEADLLKQVSTNGRDNVLPGLSTNSQSSLWLQGQQAFQHQPAIFYLVGNVSIWMLTEGFCAIHCWQRANVIL